MMLNVPGALMISQYFLVREVGGVYNAAKTVRLCRALLPEQATLFPKEMLPGTRFPAGHATGLRQRNHLFCFFANTPRCHLCRQVFPCHS
jgi:hypothetical protein